MSIKNPLGPLKKKEEFIDKNYNPFRCRLNKAAQEQCGHSVDGSCNLVKGCAAFPSEYGEPVSQYHDWVEGDRLYCPHLDRDMVVGAHGECIGCTNHNNIPRVCVDIAVKLG